MLTPEFAAAAMLASDGRSGPRSTTCRVRTSPMYSDASGLDVVRIDVALHVEVRIRFERGAEVGRDASRELAETLPSGTLLSRTSTATVCTASTPVMQAASPSTILQ